MHGQSLSRMLSPVPISNYPLNIVDQFTSNTQDFASTLLENLLGVITSLSTLLKAFDKYVQFNKKYPSKGFKDTENYLLKWLRGF